MLKLLCLRSAAFGLAALALGLPSTAGAYGGEDVKDGLPWHHLDNTLRALAGDANADARTPATIFPGAGFDREAAMSVAWHADYIDSYLYNPLFWAQGGLTSRRLKAALLTFEDLAKLHHDDTFTTAGVRDNWERYGAGTLTGLYWASLQFDTSNPNSNQSLNAIAAAHNILGVSVHSVQDFYSHSNWMDDPARRSTTWLETVPTQRNQLSLFTGAYELPATQGPAHHGAYSLSCSLLSGRVSNTLSTVCGGISPLQNTALCEEYRACEGSTPVTISVGSIAPDNIVYLNPRGIALDTTWLAQVDAIERGLTVANGSYRAGKATPPNSDGTPLMSENRCNAVVNYGVACEHSTRVGLPGGEKCTVRNTQRSCSKDSDYLFAESKELAIRSTTQWVGKIETAMIAMGSRQSSFWNAVKTTGSSMNRRTAQFENFGIMPFQFLSAGPYPVRNAAPAGSRTPPSSSRGYYLRLKIKTSTDSLSGTDADIIAYLNGNGRSLPFKLDYLPTDDPTGRTDSRIFAYNDFEKGDHDAYVIGPVPFRPESVTLRNNSANAGDVAEALWDDFTDGVDSALTSIRRGLLSIIGGNADLVGTTSSYAKRDLIDSDIAGASNGVRTRALTISSGDEGSYRLYYTKRQVSTGLTAAQRAEGWKAYEYAVTKLKCLRESTVDRGSNSDEPFFFFSLSPLNGLSDTKVFGYRRGPFSDVDDGEERNATAGDGSHKTIVKLPPNGGVALAFQLFESDDENANDRNQLYQTFITGLDEETRRGNSEFTDTVGRAVAADWKVDQIEAFLFRRGPVPEAGSVLAPRPVGWIDGGQSRNFTLSNRTLKKLSGTGPLAVNNWYVSTQNILDLIERPDALQLPNSNPTVSPDIVVRPSTRPAITPLPKIDPDAIIAPWQGTWSSSFGELRLRQDGTRVYGDYADVGIIDGQIGSDGKLTARFTNNGREGVVEFNRAGTTLNGNWRWATDKAWQGTWNGNRQSSDAPRLRNWGK